LYYKKLNILFRISGGRAFNKELGMGHVYRSVNLATQLKPHSIHFLVEDYGKVIELLKKSGFRKIYSLKKEINIELDIEKTISLVKRKNIDILIIDKYDKNTKKICKKNKKNN